MSPLPSRSGIEEFRNSATATAEPEDGFLNDLHVSFIFHEFRDLPRSPAPHDLMKPTPAAKGTVMNLSELVSLLVAGMTVLTSSALLVSPAVSVLRRKFEDLKLLRRSSLATGAVA